jgi:hypothetical protein
MSISSARALAVSDVHTTAAAQTKRTTLQRELIGPFMHAVLEAGS